MSHGVRREDSSQDDCLVASDTVRSSVPVLLSILPHSVSVLSSCKGFDSGSPGSHHRDPPYGPALLPHFGKDFSCSFLLKQVASHGLSCPCRKTMCLLPDSLKTTNFRFPWESCLPPAGIHVFGTASAHLSLEALELGLFCQQLFLSTQKDCLPYPWLQDTNHPLAIRTKHVPESYLNHARGHLTL